jgi:hypothetical protein
MRTVLTKEELSKFWNWSKRGRPFIIKFLYAYSLPKRLNLKRLIELGVIGGVDQIPRGIGKIGWNNLQKILKESESDESIIGH